MIKRRRQSWSLSYRQTITVVLYLSTIVCGISFTYGAFAQVSSSDQFALRDGDRVVFYGDSITAQRLYTRFVEDMVVTRYPDLKVRFFNAGMGGDRVTGGGAGTVDQRLARDVFPLKPTVITVMLGMNDGNYRTNDPTLLQRYEDGYRALVLKLKAGAPDARLYLIRPSPYDEFAHGPSVPGYNDVLIQYGKVDEKIAAEVHVQVLDLNAPVVAELRKAVALDPVFAATIIGDRIHPSAAGHWIMAEELVHSWGFRSLISSTSIDLVLDKVTSDVTNLKREPHGALQWTLLEPALPLPLDPDDVNIQMLLKVSDLSSLDQEPLRVSGLTSDEYTLFIDGIRVGDFRRDQLIVGINLAMLTSPITQQAQSVDHVADDRAKADALRFTILTQGTKLAHLNETIEGLSEWDELRWQQEVLRAKPIAREFRLVPFAAGNTLRN